MKKFISILTVYIFLFACGSVFAIGERTIPLGGAATWAAAENRTSVTEAGSIRPYPVLILSSVSPESTCGYSAAAGVLGNFSALSQAAGNFAGGASLDLSVSFDERNAGLFLDSTGNYLLLSPPEIDAVDRIRARSGTGAVLFGRSGASSPSGPIILKPQSGNALFAQGNRLRDFTIEFWLYPQNFDNGEQMLSWTANKRVNGRHVTQRISCSAFRNRIRWSFDNFFTSTDGAAHISLELLGKDPVVPKKWSHHLVRFDAMTGLLEYVVDGVSEAIVYATRTGRENSEVFTPVTGNGSFLLGENFIGLMDEFKVHSVFAGRSSVSRYAAQGGRIETRPVDLGENSSGVLRINASGGRTSVRGTAIQNEWRENGRFRFSDAAEMNFFIRASENPYLLPNSQWKVFIPGEEISGVRGRYVQIKVDFYPSADGESSPYLEQLRIVYLPGEAPLPPRNLTAVALDGSVQLRWRHSPADNTAGYLVYYSAVRGELFGDGAALGSSPIDAGNTNNLLIEGLKNGTLYYFRVAAYNLITGEETYNIGEFSSEVTARPLSGL